MNIPRKLCLAALCCALVSAQAYAAPQVRVGHQIVTNHQGGPTDADCLPSGYSCYSPQQFRHAYGIDTLINAGFGGAGQTIVIIDSFGSPTIKDDLRQFDADYGLPDPRSFKVLAPLGALPFDPNNNDMVNWAFETTLDVEWAHAMAPEANIVLLTSPVSETEGVQGMPEFLALEKYALDHHLGKIISQSWGATENTLFDQAGRKVLRDFYEFHERARRERVTVLASTGDFGTANQMLDGINFFPFPTVLFPASSPLVTAVGGTTLYADASGNYQSETVWNEPGCCATGGGISQYFGEPDYQEASLQRDAQRLLADKRGIPDLSIHADPFAPIFVYLSFLGSANAGYYSIGGTSEGAPEWAGIVADLSQYAGRPIGFLNEALYRLGASGRFYQFGRDITVGNNGLIPGIPGYNATPGWDATTGWGTPNLVNILREDFEIHD